MKNEISNIARTSGAEGPAHDPYSFTEYKFDFRGARYIVHDGLAEWIKVDGKKIENVKSNDLGRLIGVTMDEIIELYEGPQEKLAECEECGGSEFGEIAGFPGEYLTQCCNCGCVVSSRINMGEIE